MRKNSRQARPADHHDHHRHGRRHVADGDPSFRSPMAIAVIGGLITSTLLNLLVIPVVFTYLDDLAHLIARGWGRLRNRPAASSEPRR